MKRSIAMRCTQEQFDGIRDKINHNEIGSFKRYPYLVTKNYFGQLSNTGLINGYSQVYEQWDENIFLEACGIDPEKIEYQIFFDGKWHNEFCPIRVKPKFDKEIEQIKSLAKEIGYNVILELIK